MFGEKCFFLCRRAKEEYVSQFFLPRYNYINEFSFADTNMSNSGTALEIKSLSPVSNSVPGTCLVGCLN